MTTDEERSCPAPDQVASVLVTQFAGWDLPILMDAMVECTVRYNIGDMASVDDYQLLARRVALAVLDRLEAFGLGRKRHHVGCSIWEARLCRCPWEVVA